MRIEWIPLVINVGITIFYLLEGTEPGKTIYWAGASILTVGLLIMRG